MMNFAQTQNRNYGIGGISLAAALTLGLSGSPGWLTATTLGISGGILGSTALAGMTISRKADELRAQYVQMAEESESRHDRRRIELEAQIETAKQGYEETLQRAQKYKADLEQAQTAHLTLLVRLEGLQATAQATAQTLEQVQTAYAALQEQHEALKTAADRDWEFKEALEKELTEVRLRLNRSQADIERDIKLATLEGMNAAVQEAVAIALENKMAELAEAHADIGKLLQRLEESNGIIRDTRDNAIPAIRTVFDSEVNARDSQLLQLAGENTQLKQQLQALQAPRQFTGETSVDRAGNRIIQHFYTHGIVLDALEVVAVPQGFKLRFKGDRNPSQTKLTQEEFSKLKAERGMQGLSHQELQFDYDPHNLIVSVLLDTVGAIGHSRSALTPTQSVTVSEVVAAVTEGALSPEDSFRSLGCFPASDFERVIRDKFVPRVRVVAGSTGGKSPLLELIACGIAQIQGGELWLVNPIPGSEKDWFHIPGVIPPGTDGIQAAITWLKAAHREFQTRRNDLPGTVSKPFITVLVDEINAIAREYGDLGTVIKDFYQLSDHTRMGFLTAGQGGNVSGVSGGVSKKATGNASKLMAEDFQNATQVMTAQAAMVWLKQHRAELLPDLKRLEELCQQLNAAGGLSARPKPGTKIVDRDAYRVALVVSPTVPDPFFIQIPPYSSYVGKLTGVSFPTGAKVTAPQANQIALGLIEETSSCPHCGSMHLKRSKNRGQRGQYKCQDCGKYHTA
jgi:predicted RNA-binding Zn-ribbon protein involved in translation (DUF1610 family)